MDLRFLLALQEFRNGAGACLSEFFSKMTYLGDLGVAIVIMAVIYWSVEKELGAFLFMGWGANRIVNGALKITACVYRPWIRDPRIIPYDGAIETATGYSFPSGHTTNAASVYGGGAMWKNMPRSSRIVLGILVALVAFSRPFLGVHTPQDILVGAAAGLLVMFLILKLLRWIGKHPEKDVLVLIIGLVVIIALAFYGGLKYYPADFDAEGKLIVDGAKMAKDTFKGVGWSAGVLTGWFLERRFVKFSTDVPLGRKLARTAAGLVGHFAVYLILGDLIKGWFPGTAGVILANYLELFFIVFLFPWFFSLAEKKEQTAQRRPA